MTTSNGNDQDRVDDANHVDGIVLIPEPTQQRLNDKQVEDYRMHREKFVKWLLHLGRVPDRGV